jgi:hypothetical protein
VEGVEPIAASEFTELLLRTRLTAACKKELDLCVYIGSVVFLTLEVFVDVY